MVVVLKNQNDSQKVETFIEWITDLGLDYSKIVGEKKTIIALLGDTMTLDINLIRSLSIVDDAYRIQEPYKKANRKIHKEDTIIMMNNRSIGEGFVQVIAGPCSVESREQIITIAKDVKKSGATFLRGGAFKPRTSPYTFQGMREDGLDLLLEAKAETGLPIVTEIMSVTHIDYFEDIDILQVGARNMQNFELLKELGKIDKPILLKRGLSNTLEELLMSAEYIMAGGNENVILCERGIRTFETATRNTLDLSAVPFLKSRSHLPVIIDPSHACGHSWMVPALSKAAIAVGADGLIIEVHNNPEQAWSDGPQSLDPEQFDGLMIELSSFAKLLGKKVGG